MGERRFGQYAFETSNEDKVLFPEAKITKGDLIDYYADMAEVMLPHMKDRPVTMHRFPDGVETDGFYHKDAPEHYPGWIERAPLSKEGGGTVHYVVCGNAATLAYLAQQACITPHVWLSRRDEPKRPDRIVIDLDPSGNDFNAVRQAARQCAELFDELGLKPFFQLTGSRGIHVVTPIRRAHEFDEARQFAQDMAKLLAGRHDDEMTVEVRKNKRGNRIFLDTARIAYGQTMVTPYAVRARPNAPVATPIERDELSDSKLKPDRYTMKTIGRRLGQRDDPWKSINRAARSMDGPRKKLTKMMSDARAGASS